MAKHNRYTLLTNQQLFAGPILPVPPRAKAGGWAHLPSFSRQTRAETHYFSEKNTFIVLATDSFHQVKLLCWYFPTCTHLWIRTPTEFSFLYDSLELSLQQMATGFIYFFQYQCSICRILFLYLKGAVLLNIRNSITTIILKNFLCSQFLSNVISSMYLKTDNALLNQVEPQ